MVRKTGRIVAFGTLTSVVGVMGYQRSRALLRAQAAKARELIGTEPEDALGRNKTYRKRYPGPPIELLVLGDSIAAGLGAQSRGDTLGARLSKTLARALGRRVRLTTLAVVGSETRDVLGQIDQIPPDYCPDLIVLICGGNDVTHRISVEESTGHLRECLERLKPLRAQVVLGLCPDLQAVRPVPQPLRSLAGRESRRLARAQLEVALDAGAHAVSLGFLLGPLFIKDPTMFSEDQFHPSSLGYRRTASAMLPSLLAALGQHSESLPTGHYSPDAPRPNGRWSPLTRTTLRVRRRAESA